MSRQSAGYGGQTSYDPSPPSSSSSRVSEAFNSVPLVTCSIISLNVFIHIFNFLFTVDISDYTIQARIVLENSEYYRILTSAFIHGGIFHIGMNMMSLYQLGGHVERTFGSLQFLFVTIWSIILCGFLYCYLSWFLTYLTKDISWYLSNAVGYSGVLFAYAMIYSYHASSPTQSIMNMVEVPSKLYPWILLFLIQILLPNISMMGHLSGVIIGFCIVSGMLHYVVLPSDAFYEKVESYQGVYCLSSFTRMSSFTRHTNVSLKSPDIYGSPTSLNSGADRSWWSMVTGSFLCCYDVFGSIYRWCWYVIDTLSFMFNCYENGRCSISKESFHNFVFKCWCVLYNCITCYRFDSSPTSMENSSGNNYGSGLVGSGVSSSVRSHRSSGTSAQERARAAWANNPSYSQVESDPDHTEV